MDGYMKRWMDDRKIDDRFIDQLQAWMGGWMNEISKYEFGDIRKEVVAKFH